RQCQPTGAKHTKHRAELRIALLAQRFVKTFTIKTGSTGDIAHASSACDDTDRITDERCVASLQGCRYVLSLSLWGIEILGYIEACRLDHRSYSSNSATKASARLMSRCCVRLSPPHSNTTITAPRRT